MTLHIILKDLRRLWPFVAGLALLHLAMAVLRLKLGLFPEDHPALRQLVQNLELLDFLLIAFTAVMVVQLDPITDDRQDWLARPIHRRDLLLAKLGFMIALVLGPLFAAGLLQGVASGFPFGRALAAAASWSLHEFVNPVLPALVVAAVSRSIGQSLGLALAIGAGSAALVWGYSAVTGTLLSSIPTLVSWLIWNALIVAGAAAILRLQYFRRATLASRVLLGVFPLLILASQLMLPVSTALAMQAWLLPAPDIAVTFRPEARQPVTDTEAPRHASSAVRIALPLQIDGLPPGLTLLGERVKATFTAPDGTSAESEASEVRLQGGAPFQQRLSVQRDFFHAHAGENIRVELEYFLGVMRPQDVRRIPAAGGDLWLPEGAHCISRINKAGSGVQLGCLQAGNVHDRLTATLMEGAGQTSAWVTRHLPSEAPYSNGSDMIAAFTMNLALRDPQANLPAVEVRMFQPVTHLLRRVIIPDLRLADWKTGMDETVSARPGP